MDSCAYLEGLSWRRLAVLTEEPRRQHNRRYVRWGASMVVLKPAPTAPILGVRSYPLWLLP
jgi:hypothetical protein